LPYRTPPTALLWRRDGAPMIGRAAVQTRTERWDAEGMADRVYFPARARDPARGSRLRLLGEFDLVLRGRSLELPRTAQRVVAFLALSDHPLSRGHVADTLWPEASEAHAMGSLRSALFTVRRSGASVVVAAGHDLRLDPSLAVDVNALSQAARAIAIGGDEALAGVDRATIDLLVDAGDLLPSWDDDWLVTERERLRQHRLQALERLAATMTLIGRPGVAVELGLAAVRADPYRESAHRALITAFIAQGNRSEALRQYRSYEALAADDLGVEPSTELQELIAEVRR
jgi:DNA-binding SARP family transcriptional activator